MAFCWASAGAERCVVFSEHLNPREMTVKAATRQEDYSRCSARSPAGITGSLGGVGVCGTSMAGHGFY